MKTDLETHWLVKHAREDGIVWPSDLTRSLLYMFVGAVGQASKRNSIVEIRVLHAALTRALEIADEREDALRETKIPPQLQPAVIESSLTALNSRG